MTAILAIDPGETTGLAWCDTIAILPSKIDERMGHLVSHGQIGGALDDQCAAIMRGIARLDVRIVVIESFQLRPGRMLKGKSALSPVQLGAKLEAAIPGTIDTFWQTAGQGKSVMTDQRLRILGLWWPGEQHARDAARHLVTFIRRARQGKVDVGKALVQPGDEGRLQQGGEHGRT